MALLEVRLGCVRGPTRLCSRSDSALLEVRISWRLGIIATQGSGHLDSVWLGSAWLGSARLGLLRGARFIWGLDSGPEALPLGWGISSGLGSAQLRVNSRIASGFATRR